MAENISEAFQNLITSVRTAKPVDTHNQHSFNLFRSKILSDHDQIRDKKRPHFDAIFDHLMKNSASNTNKGIHQRCYCSSN